MEVVNGISVECGERLWLAVLPARLHGLRGERSNVPREARFLRSGDFSKAKRIIISQGKMDINLLSRALNKEYAI